MPPEVLAKAFKPFYSTRTGGTGLGLPTTRKIIEAHGGTDHVPRARSGKGTRFTIRLPVAGARPRTRRRKPVCVLNGERMPLAEAKVSVLDRGFLFGDGIYEVLRVYNGKPWLEEDHFDRLVAAWRPIRIDGVDLDRLREHMRETIASGALPRGAWSTSRYARSGPRVARLPGRRQAAGAAVGAGVWRLLCREAGTGRQRQLAAGLALEALRHQIDEPAGQRAGQPGGEGGRLRRGDPLSTRTAR